MRSIPVLQPRVLARHLHLWLGMSLGLLVALLSLTGAALVFYVEIDAALHPADERESSQRVPALAAPDWTTPVWDDVLATARREFPSPHGEWSLEATGEAGPIPARFYPVPQHAGHDVARQMVWFSADGRRVLRSQAWGGYLMSWIYELHMHLLLGDAGVPLVGWGGLASLLVLVTGIVSWWPRGSWRNALSFKHPAVALRRLRDLHKHGGLWSVPLSILLILTGVLLSLPGFKAQLLQALMVAPDAVPAPRSSSDSGAQIPVGKALAAAHVAMPEARLAFVDVPAEGGAPFRIRVQGPDDPHRRFPGSFVFVDQHSGRVLAIHDVARGNAATRVAKWIRPIHDGSIGGLATRLLAIVLGLLPTAMLITGFLYWQQRRVRRLGRSDTTATSHRK